GLLVFVLARRGHVQRRFLDGLGLFVLVFGFGALVLLLVVFILVLGIGGLYGAGIGGLGDAAAALLEQRFGLIAETAFGAFDRPLCEVVKPRIAAGACPFGSKICLDQDDASRKKRLLEGRVCHGLPRL